MSMFRKAIFASLLAVLVHSAVAWGATEGTLLVRTINTSSYPEISVEVGLPRDAGNDTPRFEIRENGEKVGNVQISRLARTRPFEVVLVVDASGSMRGRPMQDARAAARKFIDRLPDSASVAIIAIGSSPDVVQDFTTDRQSLYQAISKLEAKGETAVYDALVRAAGLKSSLKGNAERTVLLLSDGGDTTSGISLGEASKEIRNAKVPVLTAAISSPEFNEHALEVLSQQSGGRLVAVKNSSQLADRFQRIASEISTGYRLTFKSARPSTKDLEYDIAAVVGANHDVARLVVDNPLFSARILSSVEWERVVPNRLALAACLIFAFAGVSTLAGGLMATRSSSKSSMRLVGEYGRGLGDPGGAGHDRSMMPDRIVDAVEAAAGRHGFTHAIGLKLERAGMALRPAEWITFHALAVVVVGFVVQLVVNNMLVSAVAVGVLSALPLAYLDRKAAKRTKLFNEQLPDTLGILAGGMRTGWGLQQAISLVIEEGLDPTASEFRRVETETRLGVALEDSLHLMAERLGSEPFEWITTAIAIQREVGGNLAEVLDTVAASLREREALFRQVQALTAEGNISAVVLSILPFAVFGFMFMTNPDYILGALVTPAGWAIFALAGVMLAVGLVWLKATSRIEF